MASALIDQLIADRIPLNALPQEDGITHINVYTKGETQLGRLLTNLAPVPLTHPSLGYFQCAEGLWFYLATGQRYEEFRHLNGFQAKRLGRTLPRVRLDDFKALFTQGLQAKIRDNDALCRQVKDSQLPFVHYYYYGKKHNATVRVPKNQDWVMRALEQIRADLQYPPPFNPLSVR